jgi:hypothetical protein
MAVDGPAIVKLLLGAFAAAGDPEALTVEQIADHLEDVDPATWGRWAGRADRTARIGRAIKVQLKDAGLDVPSFRWSGPAGQKTAYRLADIRDALENR